MLLRTFETREARPMMNMFNSYIRSKLEYCSMIWNPHKKEEIDKIERIQKHFTSKIRGLEHMDYHERLKKLGIYSLERRRERFLIINAWQQLVGIVADFIHLRLSSSSSFPATRFSTFSFIPSNCCQAFIMRNRSLLLSKLYIPSFLSLSW